MYARHLTADEVVARVARYQPLCVATARASDQAHTRWGRVWHVNCHSMQEVASAMSTRLAGTPPRPDFVLGDLDGTACEPGFTETVRAFLTERGYSVAINDLYKGMELIRTMARPALHRNSIQIEVNRKLYMDETTREPNAGYAELKASFTDLAAHLAQYVETRLQRNPAE